MNAAPGVRLECRNVRKEYRRTTAVRDASFAVEAGARVGIVGESGSGKSTMVKIIMGVEHATSGSVTIDGQDVRTLLSTRQGRLDYRRRVQLVAQDTTTTFDPRRTVRDALRTPAQILGGHDRRGADEAVDAIAGELEIDLRLIDRYPSELSGGQRQRMSIARALVVRPGLLVCDEAVSALDVSVQGTVLNLLKRYSLEHGAGLLFVSHGLPATSFLTSELVVMRAGEVVEAGRTRELIESPRHPYTAHLVSAYTALETAG